VTAVEATDILEEHQILAVAAVKSLHRLLQGAARYGWIVSDRSLQQFCVGEMTDGRREAADR
jgi:hypothetical protein